MAGNIKIPFTGDLNYDEDNIKESISYFHLLAQQPNSNIFYILCKNQLNNGIFPNYYFSSDPRDFQVDQSNFNTKSSGSVYLNYSKNGESQFNFKDAQSKSDIKPFTNLEINSTKDPNSKQNINLNFKNSFLNYGIQYSFNNFSGPIQFRKTMDNSIGLSQGACGIFPSSSFDDTFFKYMGVCVYQDGSNLSITGSAGAGTCFYIEKSGMQNSSRYFNQLKSKSFGPKVKDTFVLELNKEGKTEYVRSELTKGSDFRILDRKLYGSESLGSEGVTGIDSVKMDVKNKPMLFENKRNLENYNYFIIPTKIANSYFHIGGLTGTHGNQSAFSSIPVEYYTNDEKTTVYNAETGLSIGGYLNTQHSSINRKTHSVNIQSWTTVNFFVFYTSSGLPNSLWKYPTYKSLTQQQTEGLITAFSWGKQNQAAIGYIPWHCSLNEKCGNCTTGSGCEPTQETPKVISGESSQLPLSESTETTDSNKGIFIWSSFAITCLLVVIWLIVFYYLIDSLTSAGKNIRLTNIKKLTGLDSLSGPVNYSTQLDEEAKLGYNISNESYKGVDERKDLGDWKYKKEDSDKNIAVYHNPKTNESYVGYRGTADLADVKVDAIDKEGNILRGTQRNNPRFKRSLAKYNEIKGKYGGETKVAGHSLGGTISEYVSKETGAKAQLYNPGRGVDKETIKDGVKCKLPKGMKPEFCNNVTKHIIEGDVVSVGDRAVGYGKTHIYKNPNEKEEGKIGKVKHMAAAHGLANFEKYT